MQHETKNLSLFETLKYLFKGGGIFEKYTYKHGERVSILRACSPHPLPGYQSPLSTRIPVLTLYQDTSPHPLPGYQSSPSTRIVVPNLYQDTSPHPLP